MTQIGRGEDYRLLAPSIVIIWMVEPLLDELERFHSVFELRERHTHVRLGEQLAIHVLQLSAMPTTPQTGYAARLHRWARFLTATSEAELERLAAEDPIMTLATQTLHDISDDPVARRRAQRIREEEFFRRMELATERASVLGKTLLDLLEQRFGPPSPSVRALVRTAAPKYLSHWIGQVLTASTVDEVLASEPPRFEPSILEPTPPPAVPPNDITVARRQERAEALLELLELRFGAPSDRIRALVETAPLDRLRTWTRQVLTASTLYEALAL